MPFFFTFFLKVFSQMLVVIKKCVYLCSVNNNNNLKRQNYDN